MTELTTINIKPEQLEEMNNAAIELFGTDAVARRAVVEKLLIDHPDVSYER